MDTNETNEGSANRPNILILCMDQWDTHMDVPSEVPFPAMERLEAKGVSFDRQYCSVPICTPSRATMWTGAHANLTGAYENTNFAWIDGLSHDIPTIGHMLREQGYYTAFKGKWHLSWLEHNEDALEAYGFSDFQQWGEMYGAPLEGALLDGTVAFETVDWLETKAPTLDQPWLLVCNLVNPHDIMFYLSDPVEMPPPGGSMGPLKTPQQRLGWFDKEWDIGLPDNLDDDLELHPYGVRAYKESTDFNYGRVPDDRPDLWIKRRNYLVNCMRLVDAQFNKVLDALDRQGFWDNTVVLFTEDHGELNGAHRMHQKGAITFDEAAIVNLTACVPGGPRGKRTAAVGSHLDLAPTLLEFAGLNEQEIRARYPHLKGRSLKRVMLNPNQDGPRGSVNAPGDGVLFCWDGLASLDFEWAKTGVMRRLSVMDLDPSNQFTDADARLKEAGAQYGAPDFSLRTFFRCVVDGQYKLVRWFSPNEYGNPSTLDELYATGDVGLYDLVNDPGELQNIGHPEHPNYDPALVERMLEKLHALVQQELGDDHAPFDLDLFGTREVKYRQNAERTAREG
jgi:arylsulfatase A-like enzyme